MHYQVLGLNESSIEDDMKKACCSLALRFHPDKIKHSHVTEVMRMLIKAKENLESTLRHIDEIREGERVRMDVMREEERARMSQNDVIILSDEKYDSGRR